MHAQSMNTTGSVGEREKKAYSTKLQAKTSSSTGCSFCWLALATYPTLKGMTPRDGAAFQEHLKKAHGLTPEILP
jgi:hypothetical protein